jgi:RNA polymerase sigma-70 factor (ECF subfamily)
MRMSHPNLVGEFDSVDICQSVLGSFFVRLTGGEFDLETPERLAALLLKMARHKLLDQVKRRYSLRRDVRRTDHLDGASFEPSSRSPEPSRLLASRELWEEVRSRLRPEERAVAELRCEGLTWIEVADRRGGTADSRRKQLSRALARVAVELGFEEADFVED